MNALFSPYDTLGFLGFWSWDKEAAEVDASPAIRPFIPTGAERGAENQASQARVHPDDLVWLRTELPRCIGPNGHGVVEYRVIDASGHVRWVMSRAIYETDAGGALVRGHGMLIDITEFKMDGGASLAAPTPFPRPLQTLIDATLTAHEAAKQVGDRNVVKQLELVLLFSARLLAEQITRDRSDLSTTKRVH